MPTQLDDKDDFTSGMTKVFKEIPKEGMRGEFTCPICKTGTIRWMRVSSNKHLRVACTTPSCVIMMQ